MYYYFFNSERNIHVCICRPTHRIKHRFTTTDKSAVKVERRFQHFGTGTGQICLTGVLSPSLIPTPLSTKLARVQGCTIYESRTGLLFNLSCGPIAPYLYRAKSTTQTLLQTRKKISTVTDFTF